jgi:hypothetical protein
MSDSKVSIFKRIYSMFKQLDDIYGVEISQNNTHIISIDAAVFGARNGFDITDSVDDVFTFILWIREKFYVNI